MRKILPPKGLEFIITGNTPPDDAITRAKEIQKFFQANPALPSRMLDRMAPIEFKPLSVEKIQEALDKTTNETSRKTWERLLERAKKIEATAAEQALISAERERLQAIADAKQRLRDAAASITMADMGLPAEMKVAPVSINFRRKTAPNT